MSRSSRLVLRLLRTSLGGSGGTGNALQSASHGVRRVSARGNSTIPITTSDHTAKWMTKFDQKSPQDLIAEVPPIEVTGRVIACEGGRDPALGHPIEYICVDLSEPATCKYCGLRYVQDRHHH